MRGFDKNHPRWICCCVHITNGTLLIAMVELLLIFYSLLRCVVAFASGATTGIYWDRHVTLIVIEFINSFIMAIMIGLLIFGVRKRVPNFLLPHLVMQVVTVLL